MNRYTRIAFAFLVLCVATSMSARAQSTFRVGDPAPAKVIKDWQSRREACRSIHWKIEARELITAGLLNGIPPDNGEFGQLPKADMWRTRYFDTWVGFSPVRCRAETSGEQVIVADDGTTPYEPIHFVTLYDGSELQTVEMPVHGRRPLPRAAVRAWTLSGHGPGLALEEALLPCFWGLGRIFDSDTPMRVDRLGDVTVPQRLRIHAVRTEGEATIITLRAPLAGQRRFQEFDVDVSRDSVVTRVALYLGERLEREFRLQWKGMSGQWILDRWAMVVGPADDGTPTLSSECVVREWDVNVPLDGITFRVPVSPGDAYWDERSDTVLVKSADGRPDVPLKVVEIEQAALEQRRYWIYAVLMVLGVAAVIWSVRRQ